MYQTQVNITNSALDCTESRTVLTINNKKHMHKQQNQQHKCSISLSAPTFNFVSGHHTHSTNDNFVIGNPNNEKSTCQFSNAKTAASTAIADPHNTASAIATLQSTRLSVKTRPHKRLPTMMKSYALLPVICIAIFAQISCVAGRTVLGRRLHLHTAERRIPQRYEGEFAPSYKIPPRHSNHHHLNRRSLKMDCNYIKSILETPRAQAKDSANTLTNGVGRYTAARFNTTPENATIHYSLHKLQLFHPYYSSLDEHRNFTAKANHNFNHLDKKHLSLELLEVELKKIYTTIRMLQDAFSKLYNEHKSKQEKYEQTYQKLGFKEMSKFINASREELNSNRKITESTLRTLNSKTPSISYENNVKFNETNSFEDWLIIAENISFLHYLNELYEKLLNMCNATESTLNI